MSFLINKQGDLVQHMASGEVSRLTGVSLRQLQWWDERGVISPRQEGHRRVYTLQDVAEVSLIGLLRKKNISLQKIRRALAYLRKDAGSYSRAVNGRAYLLLDTGLRKIHLETEPERVCELMNASPRAMVLVRVPEVHDMAARA